MKKPSFPLSWAVEPSPILFPANVGSADSLGHRQVMHSKHTQDHGDDLSGSFGQQQEQSGRYVGNWGMTACLCHGLCPALDSGLALDWLIHILHLLAQSCMPHLNGV